MKNKKNKRNNIQTNIELNQKAFLYCICGRRIDKNHIEYPSPEQALAYVYEGTPWKGTVVEVSDLSNTDELDDEHDNKQYTFF